jgi:DNA-binding transcriptional regulator YiaG
MMITAKEIKDIRNGLNLSQSKFSKLFGIGLRAIQQWENGNRTPSPTGELLLRIIESNPDVVIEVSKKIMNKND